ncbi:MULTISPECIES: glycosyltransferase family 39 protein [Clostridium]|uniref:glycosyltransferase family 39 protein n=1 Tax=Clostridium TaxID=1485 RepID=UPI0005C15C28|nr:MULTISPECIES: glycosyltransferase family 39 protein [Clostridium]AXB87063.1 glycosyltransferase family 39 protein [Clostridium butyricum]KIU04947.1 glycosyl transferase family 39 [Clostridium butyricum]MBA8968941.1 4-amino-4-deoxy-L-arabinose transferase-like glycosyltransferase [Clostridium butyricum]MBA8973202.1 4-amino-4-deoxy-L-arabinose transferase-like glycosyltransferase [Clostridium butyricum]MBC2428476.1 glycosyltransferase family 39 protein [Clostridium butyricum]
MIEKLRLAKEKFGIGVILILSIILNFANLGIEGHANTYYSAGVKSMMMNLKNFFFVSSDPSGFVTIDKPPVGFWLQTISAKIFGFSGWSVILPQALAGVISVWLIYYLVKRSFGTLAALVAALCLAVTPIFVAASRNNTIDNLLVLSLLLACLTISLAAEQGKFKYLILSLVLVGIGFNIKMVEAYMLAPAVFITYFLSSAISYKKKIKHLIFGGLVLLAVSLSWALAVDLIPASNRPFIGSSTDNSVMELIIGHNGLERIGLGEKYTNRGNNPPQELTDKDNNLQNQNRTSQNQMPAGRNGMGNNSKTGITRLFTYNNLSDQISWLLPFAIIGAIIAVMEEKVKLFNFDNKRKLSLLLWSMWLLPEFIYFSFSKNVTHTYYLTTMAPSIAALTGIGLTTMWKLYNEESWKKWILPVAFIVNGLIEILILSPNYKTSNGYRVTLLATGILSIGASIALIIAAIIRRKNSIQPEKVSRRKSNIVITSIAFIGILIAPMVWSSTTLFYPMNGSSPAAGLELASGKQGRNFSNSSNFKLIQFLEANKQNEQYLVAVPSAMTYASDLILKTGEPVMTIGGFSGSDKIISLDEFKQLVSQGAVRYALVSSGGRMGGGSGKSNSNNDIMSWIKANGKLVPNSEWKDSTTSDTPNNNQRSGGFGGEANSAELYDLS